MHFDYADVEYDSTSKTNQERLQNIQTRDGSGPYTSCRFAIYAKERTAFNHQGWIQDFHSGGGGPTYKW